jgi:uncharacterized protein with ACT and thioredoxin-like domain
MGRILYNAVLSVSAKQMKEALKLPEGVERDNRIKGARFLEHILSSNSLRSLAMCGGTQFNAQTAKGFIELANGHLFRGIRILLTKIEVPPLPKEGKGRTHES